MHAGLQRRALAKLKWLVVRDFAEIETASFWYDSPEVKDGELRTEDIQTEVFLMPAATHIEKEGTFTQTQRLLQWRDKALEPPGDARSELWFMHHLTKRVKERLKDSADPRDKPIQDLTWDYPEHGEHAEPSAEAVLREINGYDVATGAPVPGFAQLADDGSTACGCWIYSGVYKDGVNQARRRTPAESGAIHPEWGWAWPANRRVLYNRASADPSGKPWSERKKLVWWDEDEGKWAGPDVPGLPGRQARRTTAATTTRTGMDAIGGDEPFMMMADGRAWLFSPSGLRRRPAADALRAARVAAAQPALPEAPREPGGAAVEPARQPVRPARGPAVPVRADDVPPHRAPHRGRHVALPAVARRAAARDVRRDRPRARAPSAASSDGDWMTIMTERAEIEARALVSPRMKPLRMGDRTVHQVALPFHWSYGGIVQGDAANDLIPLSGDPNVAIQESKASVCDVRAGRTSRGTRVLAVRAARAPRSARTRTTSPRSGRRHDRDRRRASATPSGWASSPTRRRASGARRARSRASSGTTCPPTTPRSAGARRTTTPAS